MNVERFWILEPIPPGEKSGRLLGEIRPDKGKLAIWGAQFTLLCDKEQQNNVDILASVSPHPNQRHQTQDDVKSSPLFFYAQRDAYAHSSGIHDLVHLVMLPEPIVTSKPVYVKGFCGNYNKEKKTPSRYDIMVDIYLSSKSKYRVKDLVPANLTKGGF
jgi:hypothetical protein